ncbi:uncharacterized protein HMPREF1541_08169 [Cyphellophora europaea CBS 101466]|uniref:Uncharacterized protein n=1 Tax=Cyphellophora europaea (strain CBS 101466) TaxID=1220924 RepID=W2RN56_CYPE1|nr:uncharacterized protein HMPREF1541_08169 [Cyphellophora europaea CBS 101466]ETN37179.1 hypothetical protein HMPREF1541_08169 [Cyphellophora europaea CBS 101466]
MLEALGLWSLLITLLLTVAAASPLRQTEPISPSKPYLVTRSPVSAAAFQDDWPTNVVMVGGAETYGMWVPQDGDWHDTSDFSCLDVPAYNIVNCAAVTIDNIGVVSGYGPCTLKGSTGWQATLSGASGSGYTTVGPPQTIVQVQCAADD